jgi:hypothetical protein
VHTMALGDVSIGTGPRIRIRITKAWEMQHLLDRAQASGTGPKHPGRSIPCSLIRANYRSPAAATSRSFYGGEGCTGQCAAVCCVRGRVIAAYSVPMARCRAHRSKQSVLARPGLPAMKVEGLWLPMRGNSVETAKR